MSALNDLFYGNIVPAEKGIKSGGECHKLTHKADELNDKITPTLTPEQSKLFDEYKKYLYEMESIIERESFIEGFRLGVQLTNEIYTSKSENFKQL